METTLPLPATAVPPPLAEHEPGRAVFESAETLTLLALRRSTKVIHLAAPGPDAAQLDALLRLAVRVPDHGKLGPWRFVVIEGEARARAGEALATLKEDAPSQDAARATFTRSPLCVMVISTASPNPKIPEWEQVLSAGAACNALLLAAHAMGFGGCWLTGWPCYDPSARAALGLANHERIAGFIHLGTATQTPTERVRADWRDRVSRFP
ncbi:nitroreductase family protein [alpha proteobacterium U9-1i]|nr:nitroreductase family protein [alpha proteobacterium U9-1i]